jgi:hypothetical protein
LRQLARNQRHGVSRGDPKFGARIILRELRDDSGHKAGGAGLSAADTDLAPRRVDEILDLLDTRSERVIGPLAFMDQNQRSLSGPPRV